MSVNTPEQCSVGKVIHTDCHKLSYTKQKNLINVTSLDQTEVSLISLRSGVSLEELNYVCEHHKISFSEKYELNQKVCMDPFQIHKKKVTKGLRVISLDFYLKINRIKNCVKSIPGQKICDGCRKKVSDTSRPDTESDAEGESFSDTEDITILEKSCTKIKTLEELNTSIQNLGESPFKLHGIAPHSKSSYGKKKIESVTSKLKSKVSKVLEKDFSLGEELPDAEKIKENEQKIKDLDRLVLLMKEKLSTTNSQREKIQILTLVPSSWSRKKIREEFNVSEYTARKAKELVTEKGILAMPEPRKGHPLNENVIDLVKNFYQNSEYARVMPGAKDKVSISKNQYMQKVLLLGNLNELYAAFKFEHPTVKIGLTKFCMLRPKWCVLAGSAGTHFVCVCTIHENVSLLLHACSIEEHYSELIGKLVCAKDSRDCMLRHCSDCPSSENLKSFIKEKFEEWDPSDEVTYSSWISTDRTQQVQFTVTLEEYLDILVTSLEKLTPHSYVTKSQAKYLKDIKSNLSKSEAIILIDFSENYSYVLQNEVQGYHWTNNSCSLHPVVIYTKQENTEDLKVSSLCVVSDDLEHDVAFVHETQKVVSQFLKTNFPEVTNVIYYSDGCAAQYKNCKNFFNLCHHEKDFEGLKAKWCFFATSHGKSPCDGIGGTIKRIATKASLQLNPGNAIDNCQKFFDFCCTKIENIKFILVNKETMIDARQKLEERFSKAKTVPGTRSFHHFEPKSEDSIATKRVSFDEQYCTVFNFSLDTPMVKMSDVGLQNYVACIYDDKWYVGWVTAKLEDEGDVEVKFLHPHGPAPSFHWPAREDICFIPLNNIISCVSSPTTKASGRMYYFARKEMDSVNLQCSKMLKQRQAQN